MGEKKRFCNFPDQTAHNMKRSLLLLCLAICCQAAAAQTTYKELMKAGIDDMQNPREHKYAEGYFKRASQLQPDSAAPYFWLSKVYWTYSGDKGPEREALRNAIARDPKNPLYHLELGITYHETREDNLVAIDEFRQAVKYSRANLYYSFELAERLYGFDSTLTEAVELFAYVLKMDNGKPIWNPRREEYLPVNYYRGYLSDIYPRLYEKVTRIVNNKSVTAAALKTKNGWLTGSNKNLSAQNSKKASIPEDPEAATTMQKLASSFETGINAWAGYMQERQTIVTRITTCKETSCITSVFSSLQSNLQNLYDVLQRNIVDEISAKKDKLKSCNALMEAVKKAGWEMKDAAYKYTSASTLAKTVKDAYPTMKTNDHYQNAIRILFNEYDEGDVKTQNAFRLLYKAYDIFLNRECASMPNKNNSENTVYNAMVNAQSLVSNKIADEELKRAGNLKKQEEEARARSSAKSKTPAEQSGECGACHGTGKKIKSCGFCSGKGEIVKTINVPVGSSTHDETKYDRKNTDEAKLETKRITTTRYETKTITSKCSACSGKGYKTTDYNCPVCKGTGKE